MCEPDRQQRWGESCEYDAEKAMVGDDSRSYSAFVLEWEAREEKTVDFLYPEQPEDLLPVAYVEEFGGYLE